MNFIEFKNDFHEFGISVIILWYDSRSHLYDHIRFNNKNDDLSKWKIICPGLKIMPWKNVLKQ